MNIRKSVKRNLLVRGVYMLYRKYFSVRKTKFGYISESVIITPPYVSMKLIVTSTIMLV